MPKEESKPVVGAVEGNAQIIALLERWLENARAGKIALCAIATAELPLAMRYDVAGNWAHTPAVYLALECAKNMLLDHHVLRTPPPETTVGQSADRWLYNLAASPVSFDFLAWLVDKEMIRRRENAPAPLKVAFFAGRDGDFDLVLAESNRRQMFEHVVIPALALVGAVRSDELVGNQLDYFSYAPVVEAALAGEKVPTFQPRLRARAFVDKLIGNGPEPVVITLREADYFANRNSAANEWLKFADWLLGTGHRVIVLRDTRCAHEPLAAIDTCPEASINLHIRTALYERARCSFFSSNGPACLAFFGTRPWRMFQEVDPDAELPWTPNGWRFFTGIEVGAQFPWSTSQQRIVWAPQTFEQMKLAWDEFTQQERNECLSIA